MKRTLAAKVLDGIVPGARVLAAEPLGDGHRNSNFKLHLDRGREPVVLRIYEHDPAICRKELDLYAAVSREVPVPEVLRAEPEGWEDLPPLIVTRYIQGMNFRALKRTGDREAVAQASYSAGEALAAIGRVRFERSGWIGPGPQVGAPLMEGADPYGRFVDLCLAKAALQARLEERVREAAREIAWRHAPDLERLDGGARLVHGDFSRRNVMVRESGGRWQVTAVLDWEFAIAGSPLQDLGSFLRFERAADPLVEPHFSQGYRDAGGMLPPEWRKMGRVYSLVAIVAALAEEDVPPEVVAELVELARATVQDRDPVVVCFA